MQRYHRPTVRLVPLVLPPIAPYWPAGQAALQLVFELDVEGAVWKADAPLQFATAAHTVLFNSVAGRVVYVTPRVQLTTALHTRFVVVVGALVWYVCPSVQLANAAQVPNVIAVAPVTLYSST